MVGWQQTGADGTRFGMDSGALDARTIEHFVSSHTVKDHWHHLITCSNCELWCLAADRGQYP
eukprot:m.71925 g.71925  ORF g.71925 m.71925 type:complete len:62 (+) comp12320_c0_seq1:4491-4676(+)